MKIKLAIVVSEFNKDITDKLLTGAMQVLNENGIAKEQIDITFVPGAIEIPLVAKLLARTNQYSVIICLGAVIQGDTLHHEYVSQQVSEGCQQVMMQFEIPVIFGVLTTRNINQAIVRSSENNMNKGFEAAHAALQMIKVVNKIKTTASN